MERRTNMFAHSRLDKEGNVEYCDIMPLRKQLSFGLAGPGAIHEVIVRELQEGEASQYWGWWDQARGEPHFTFVFRSKIKVETCFEYGTAVEERRGRGKLLNVAVVEEL